jgi:signal peptidase I
MRNTLLFFWELVKIGMVAALIVVPIRYFIFQPFFVQGQSMEPSFFQGDYLIVDEISYRFNDPQRGEVIVFGYPNNPSQKYIKRIVGLPGETVKIKDGNVYILDRGEVFYLLDESDYLPEERATLGDLQINLGDKQYFVLGDNRSFSADSRRWGSLKEEYIVGRVFLRLWPFKAMAKMEIPEYSL